MPDQQKVQGKKRNRQYTMTSDKLVELQDLSLPLHASLLEKKPSLFLVHQEEAKKAEVVSKRRQNF